MSHLESYAFFEAVADVNEALIGGGAILEVGSFDVNGGIRELFSGASTYVGVDLCEGPGVDVVSQGHELSYEEGTFDLSLSSECFEHNPYWRETFLNMTRMTKAGGLVAISCASRGRVEHGTARTEPAHSPGTQSRGLDYYRNLEEADFNDLGLDETFISYKFWYQPGHFDLFFAGIKRGAGSVQARIPHDEQIERINALMSKPYKFIMSPFAGLSRVLPASRYQSVAVPLSNFLSPAISFCEYRRNSSDFQWSKVLSGISKRVARRRRKHGRDYLSLEDRGSVDRR